MSKLCLSYTKRTMEVKRLMYLEKMCSLFYKAIELYTYCSLNREVSFPDNNSMTV